MVSRVASEQGMNASVMQNKSLNIAEPSIKRQIIWSLWYHSVALSDEVGKAMSSHIQHTVRSVESLLAPVSNGKNSKEHATQ